MKRAARQHGRAGDQRRVLRQLDLDHLVGPAVLAEIGVAPHRVKDRRAEEDLAKGKHPVKVRGGVIGGDAVGRGRSGPPCNCR